jgi:hypothetical protein
MVRIAYYIVADSITPNDGLVVPVQATSTDEDSRNPPTPIEGRRRYCARDGSGSSSLPSYRTMREITLNVVQKLCRWMPSESLSLRAIPRPPPLNSPAPESTRRHPLLVLRTLTAGITAAGFMRLRSRMANYSPSVLSEPTGVARKSRSIAKAETGDSAEGGFAASDIWSRTRMSGPVALPPPAWPR